jgi:hypothetical protein
VDTPEYVLIPLLEAARRYLAAPTSDEASRRALQIAVARADSFRVEGRTPKTRHCKVCDVTLPKTRRSFCKDHDPSLTTLIPNALNLHKKGSPRFISIMREAWAKTQSPKIVEQGKVLAYARWGPENERECHLGRGYKTLCGLQLKRREWISSEIDRTMMVRRNDELLVVPVEINPTCRECRWSPGMANLLNQGARLGRAKVRPSVSRPTSTPIL